MWSPRSPQRDQRDQQQQQDQQQPDSGAPDRQVRTGDSQGTGDRKTRWPEGRQECNVFDLFLKWCPCDLLVHKLGRVCRDKRVRMAILDVKPQIKTIMIKYWLDD